MIAGGFCYFAYFYKNRGAIVCWANDYSEYPLPITNADVPLDDPAFVSTAENVTSKFYLAIRFGFWLAIINFSRAIIAQLSVYLNSEKLVYANYIIWSIWVCLALILFTFTNIWRYSGSGRVCSGDYLD